MCCNSDTPTPAPPTPTPAPPVVKACPAGTCNCTVGRKYAYGFKTVSKLVGIRAKIKTRYGKLCCEKECGTLTAYHVVYANITSNSGGMKWAQAGWGRERTQGSASIKKYRYAEMQGSVYKVNYDTSSAPAEGSVHTYQCELDKATGTWTYSFDGSSWQTFQDDFWKNKTGDTLQFTGEIYNKEDDMPGTTADKCSCTECKYKTDGAAAYVNAGLIAGDVRSDDAGEWGAEWISGTALNIWDKKPLS